MSDKKAARDASICYTVAEFCEVTSICKATLYELWRRGDGPPRVKLGRRTLIPKAKAVRWLERKANANR